MRPVVLEVVIVFTHIAREKSMGIAANNTPRPSMFAIHAIALIGQVLRAKALEVIWISLAPMPL